MQLDILGGWQRRCAKATRWLCSFGFDGCEIVSTILKMQFAKYLACHCPNCEGYEWSGKDSLCPLINWDINIRLF